MSFDKKVISVSGNDDTTTILTNNGEIYSAGMIDHKIQSSFQLQNLSSYLTSPIMDIVKTEKHTFILTQDGSVYEFNDKISEIYLTVSNNNDPVVSISAGKDHIIMLTKNNKVFGYGDNSKYQLVPSGECYYNHAIQLELNEYINITNVNCPDDCYVNNGLLINPNSSITPSQCNVECDVDCGTICSGMVQSLTSNYIATLPIQLINELGETIICHPIEIDISLLASSVSVSKDCSNNLTYTILGASNVYIPSTNIMYASNSGNSITCNLVTTNNTLIGNNQQILITGNTLVPNQCGKINITSNLSFDLESGKQIIYSDQTVTVVVNFSELSINLPLSGVLCVNCPPCNKPIPNPVIPQPKIVKVSAGGYSSVLVDDKNRIYTMGDISSVRQNKNLVNNCLNDLLENTYGTIKAPANQLCNTTCSNGKMDLSKINVELSLFPSVNITPEINATPQSSLNVCEFLNKLKDCNASNCNDICNACDNTIYIRNNRRLCMVLSSRKAVLKGLSYLKSINCNSSIDDLYLLLTSNNASCISNTVNINMSSDRVQIDQNEYFINGVSYPIDMFLILCDSSIRATLTGYDLMYINVEKSPQAIQFVSTAKCFNIVYSSPTYTSINSGCDYPQISVYSMIYGDVLPSVERNNYRSILGNYGFKHSYNYKNPITNKLYGTYLQGGDYIDMVIPNNNLMVSYDLPTVYNLNKRVQDIAITNQSLYVVVSTMISCPNEVYVLGNNCLGQLGLCNNFNTLCFKKINNCKTDSHIIKVFAGENAVAMITFNGFVYMAGILEGVINSTCLTYYDCACSIKPTKIILTKYNMIQLVSTQSVYGVGLNQLGQLGTGNTCKVCKCVLLDSTLRTCPKVCTTPYSQPKCHQPCSVPCSQPKCNTVITTPNIKQKEVRQKCKYFK